MSHYSDETLSHESSLAKERLASEFREAWQRGEAPDIEEYLSRDDTDTDRLVLLSALVRADLECRLYKDASARVELYLDRYPELATIRICCWT